MACDFTSVSTVVKSYQTDGRMIMKGYVKWTPVYDLEDFASGGARARDRWGTGAPLTLRC